MAVVVVVVVMAAATAAAKPRENYICQMLSLELHQAFFLTPSQALDNNVFNQSNFSYVKRVENDFSRVMNLTKQKKPGYTHKVRDTCKLLHTVEGGRGVGGALSRRDGAVALYEVATLLRTYSVVKKIVH